MSERSYCPSGKRDGLSNNLPTANREPCDSLRRGLCGGLSSYPRSRLSDHIKNLQRFPDTLGGHEIFLGHPQTCCRKRTPAAAVQGFSVYNSEVAGDQSPHIV